MPEIETEPKKFEPRLIFIDDQKPALKLLQVITRASFLDSDTHFFSEAQKSLDLLKDNIPSVIITDWQMPGMNGLDLTNHLTKFKDDYPIVYIIFLTSRDETKDLSLALQSGAQDYVKKPYSKSELIARIRTGIRTVTLQQELNELNKKLIKLSTTDSLTECFNRRHGTDILRENLEKVKRDMQKLSLMMVDIDKFKSINDKYGHNAGDMVLKETVGIINNTIRTYDTLIRWGGEEFLIILPDLALEDTNNLAERLLTNISSHQMKIESEKTVNITVSIGISNIISSNNIDLKDFVNEADQALYQAKNGGRNQYKDFVK